MDKFSLTLPNKKENVSMVRLLTSFVAAQMDFNIEEIEDLKVSVGEALNYHIGQTENFQVELLKEDQGLTINFDLRSCQPGFFEQDGAFNENLSFLILDTLMDEVSFTKDKITLKKSKG